MNKVFRAKDSDKVAKAKARRIAKGIEWRAANKDKIKANNLRHYANVKDLRAGIKALEAELADMQDYVVHHDDWHTACLIALNNVGSNRKLHWEKKLAILEQLKAAHV